MIDHLNDKFNERMKNVIKVSLHEERDYTKKMLEMSHKSSFRNPSVLKNLLNRRDTMFFGSGEVGKRESMAKISKNASVMSKDVSALKKSEGEN